MRFPILMLLLAAALPTAAAEQTESELAEVAQLGGLAATAPLCGLRDDGWAADLRGAALAAVPAETEQEKNRAQAALAHGDMEAIEDLADRSAPVACAALGRDPALARADDMVGAFRQRNGAANPGS